MTINDRHVRLKNNKKYLPRVSVENGHLAMVTDETTCNSHKRQNTTERFSSFQKAYGVLDKLQLKNHRFHRRWGSVTNGITKADFLLLKQSSNPNLLYIPF